jgi:hypothetical protein
MERCTTIFGKDAFHRVPLFQQGRFRDAVESVLTIEWDAVERVLTMKWRRA